ncbi:MAG: metallophosphoesterase [Capnocytophaga sp.]|nr:metallophosphoesterase [Capnocytophaga sp.]
MAYLIISLIFLVFFGLSFYASRALKTLKISKIGIYAFNAVALLIIANLIWQYTHREQNVWNKEQMYAMVAFLTWILVLLTVSIILFLEDIKRIAKFVFKKKKTNETRIEGRRKFISLLGLGLAAIPFASMLYGITKGKYNFKVWKYTLSFDDLPEAFDGYRITQISDIHSGSFDDREKIQYAIDLINEQKSDVLFFTGDMVNNLATEMLPWTEMFKQLKAPDGQYSVLGNHDYGDYSAWASAEAKAKNLQDIKDIHKEIGFRLLLDEHVYLEKNGQKIAVVGVENWGHGRFAKYGNLDNALAKTQPDDFKILLSHDPTHWEYVVLPENKNIQLTLSGHTHGMQFGIEIPGWLRWSPSQWVYKYWAGMYEEKGKFLNVNRGFGFHAFPGRVGIFPEITVIELKKS